MPHIRSQNYSLDGELALSGLTNTDFPNGFSSYQYNLLYIPKVSIVKTVEDDKTIDSDNNTITNLVNADIKSSAAIAFSKMADLTASRALVSDGNGDVSVSDVTSTEIGYLDGVTSAIQTQLDNKSTKGFAIAMAIAL